MKQLPEKLLNLRKAAGLSQEELAAKLNITRQAVSRWENGSAAPDAYNLLQLSKLFQVSADYLLNDDHTEPTPSAPQDPPKEQHNPVPFLLVLEALAFFLQNITIHFIGQGIPATVMAMLPFLAVILGFELSHRKHRFPSEIRRQFYLPTAILGLYFAIRILLNIASLFSRENQTGCMLILLSLTSLYNFVALGILLVALYTHFQESRRKNPS